jgi:N-acetylglucosaminyldiphosphoundecaprenol N-acetyl-beta-D-mannosaminyltransferase
MPYKLNCLSINLNLLTKVELFKWIEEGKKLDLATVNPEFLMEAKRNPAFKGALEMMDGCIIDGNGLYFLLRIWKIRKKSSLPLEHYAGADLVEDLWQKYAQGEKSFFLLGGDNQLADQARQTLKERFPNLQIVGTDPVGLLSRLDPEVDLDLVKKINASQADILLIGLGAPKQELWLKKARSKGLQTAVAIGVGGTLGFYSQKKRAPQFWRRLKLEWLYRGLHEKGHWKRLWQAVVVFSWQGIIWLKNEKN